MSYIFSITEDEPVWKTQKRLKDHILAEKTKLLSWLLLLDRWKLSELRDHFRPWKFSSQNGHSKMWNIHMWEVSRWHWWPQVLSLILAWTYQKVFQIDAVSFLSLRIFSRQWSVISSVFRSSIKCPIKYVRKHYYHTLSYFQLQMQLFHFVVDFLSIYLFGSHAKKLSITL